VLEFSKYKAGKNGKDMSIPFVEYIGNNVGNMYRFGGKKKKKLKFQLRIIGVREEKWMYDWGGIIQARHCFLRIMVSLTLAQQFVCLVVPFCLLNRRTCQIFNLIKLFEN
jgi:hypothetical protein